MGNNGAPERGYGGVQPHQIRTGKTAGERLMRQGLRKNWSGDSRAPGASDKKNKPKVG